ncbi:hypothetical protein BN2475_280047 [Paraburkholderia ribeironis]|uniref:Uncharacterized protein n=1 Tax=Paraburkholderia ribeironis TaxID=1247936 RepID=A0A1N7S184_9BURK|nr:hypothetical protein BN2475_280047 [Paraburkholderia ribeironis]
MSGACVDGYQKVKILYYGCGIRKGIQIWAEIDNAVFGTQRFLDHAQTTNLQREETARLILQQGGQFVQFK